MIDRIRGTRTDVLLRLLEGPQPIAALVERLKKNKAGIHHELAALIEAGEVARCNAKYELSQVGRIKAQMLCDMLACSKVLDEHKDFWQGHDLSGIPGRLQELLGELTGCKLIRDCPDAPIDHQAAFADAIMRAKEIYGLSGIIEPGYAEAILAVLAQGAEVSLILSEWVISQIEPRMLEKALSYENFSLYQLDGLKVAFTVTDELISLALYDHVGVYDPWQDLICEGDRAVTWGKELFEHYKDMAKVVK